MRNFNNILVTGGCGFIGSNFIRYILEKSDYKGNIINNLCRKQRKFNRYRKKI
ncbi:NAD-dependent epimerase/dehydratase family protein [Brachyspira hyodysenteriae]|uniref:NAD-dependent epimerase/dehydratase family protein n=1 Tax=Brachyspira hyodysenteriae TaxID=159 RepID=UPI0022CE05BE|nr:NAD-dependent epimerase/dehydratase family protein [Brachyspira hyodysenteriae]MCZ9887862.1 NAD-dependent epimerase/dehydratase family protein [Brachyspira hyodysenteriae]